MRPQDRARQLRPLIEKASASLPDEDALEAVELFKHWQPDEDYERGDRRQHEGKLYRALQSHHSYAHQPPGKGMEAIWEEVALPGDGTSPDKPISYNNNMALEQGKYYAQNGVVYVCTRSTVNPVYNDLADLVGLYVEVWHG